MNHNTKDRRNWSSTAQLLSALRRNGCTVVKHGLSKLDEDDAPSELRQQSSLRLNKGIDKLS
jgi:hypothetical protein